MCSIGEPQKSSPCQARREHDQPDRRADLRGTHDRGAADDAVRDGQEDQKPESGLLGATANIEWYEYACIHTYVYRDICIHIQIYVYI